MTSTQRFGKIMVAVGPHRTLLKSVTLVLVREFHYNK